MANFTNRHGLASPSPVLLMLPAPLDTLATADYNRPPARPKQLRWRAWFSRMEAHACRDLPLALASRRRWSNPRRRSAADPLPRQWRARSLSRRGPLLGLVAAPRL